MSRIIHADMKRVYTILEGRTDGPPLVHHFNRKTEVNKWLRDRKVKIHKDEFWAGSCVHVTLDGKWVLIFDRRPLAVEMTPSLLSATREEPEIKT